jgi:hypothetical protein
MVAGDVLAHVERAAGGHVDAELLAALAADGGVRGLARLLPTAGEDEVVARGAVLPGDQDPAAPDDHGLHRDPDSLHPPTSDRRLTRRRPRGAAP